MAGDQSLLRRINRMAIVRHVKSRPGLARGELAELTGLADSTISVLVNGLIEDGWLRASDSPGESRGAGRRPKLLALDPSRLAVVGAELGVDYLAVAACGLEGQILWSREVAYRHGEVERSLADVAALVGAACRNLASTRRRPLGVGLGLPGMVTTDHVLRIAPNIGWRDVAVGSLLEGALRAAGVGDLPSSVLNDANAGALGEYVFSAGPAIGSLVYLSAGYGVGAGLIFDDRLHLGHEGLSGEVGHWILQPEGQLCPCGRRGCAETLLSQKAVSRLATGTEDPTLPIAELAARLERGDPAVLAAAREAGAHLGMVLHNLVVTLNPAVLALGGPLSRLPPFVGTALERLQQLSGRIPYHHSTVRVGQHGNFAGAVGAAAGVLHDLLHPLAQRPQGTRVA
ncbi:MAG: ROK family transcriptional regulator [Deltaproteobacteria bacterium]|nr:ROK family transcriptional regulator [Deltaproteobacteria bacterium]